MEQYNYDYPTDDQLKKIENWEYRYGYVSLMEYAKSLWHWDDYFIKGKDNIFELHTGGWSGNESIIESLQSNTIFWMMCWLESKRGGHYKFEVKSYNT